MSGDNLSLTCELVKFFQGKVFFPESYEYTSSLEIDNGRINSKPYCICKPETHFDVSQMVKLVRSFGASLSVKSGGHSYNGYCIADGGIVIDLCNMRHIQYLHKYEILLVQGGALWSDVYDFLDDNSLNFYAIGGTCLSVGVSGFLLGGGTAFCLDLMDWGPTVLSLW